MKSIKIVVPIYNEEANLENFVSNLLNVISKEKKYLWTLVLVNDGSQDGSWEKIKKIVNNNNFFLAIKGLNLSRNFGKEAALSAGVIESQETDATICMDADLQHPPRYIPKLIEQWEKGADIVATVRLSTKKKSFFRNSSSRLYYWLMRKISELDMESQTTDFRLYDKKVISVFNKFTERGRIF